MSDNIDEPNNLCVPESTFEQFQAVNVFKEDEFITLADIVSPSQPTLDLNACLDEIPNDNCIVNQPKPEGNENITTVRETKTNQQQVNTESITAANKIDLGSTSTEQSVQNVAENTLKQTPKKRGRKGKSTLKSDPDYSKYEDVLNNTPNETATFDIKQGMPEELNAEEDCHRTSDNILDSQTITGVIGSLRERKRKILEKLPISGPSSPQQHRKRGRPKKLTTYDKLRKKVKKQDDTCETVDNTVFAGSDGSADGEVLLLPKTPKQNKLPRQAARKKRCAKTMSRLHKNDLSDLVTDSPHQTTSLYTLVKKSGKRGRRKKQNCSNELNNDAEDPNSHKIDLPNFTKSECGNNLEIPCSELTPDRHDTSLSNNETQCLHAKSITRIHQEDNSSDLMTDSSHQTSSDELKKTGKRGQSKKSKCSEGIKKSTEELHLPKNNQVPSIPHSSSKPPGKRRGRAKSVASCNDKKLTNLNTDHDYFISPALDSTTDKSINQNRSEGQEHYKDEATDNSETKNSEKKYDEIELELIRILSTPTIPDEGNDVTETSKHQNLPKKKGKKAKKTSNFDPENNLEQPCNNQENQISDDDDADICLSSLKKQLNPNDELSKDTNVIEGTSTNEGSLNTNEISINEINDNNGITKTKRNAKAPIMSDFEYNVDNIVSESANIMPDIGGENVLEINDTEIRSPSKRPVRRRARKVLHYDEGSDEDPFANVELSDDDLSARKSGRYYSDDEYIPGKRKKGRDYSESSMSEESLEGDNESNLMKNRKKGRKLDESLKKSKRRKQHDFNQDAEPDVTSTAADTTTQIDDDIDSSLQSPDITTNENLHQKPKAWGMSHAFEDFIAKRIQGTNLQIKKLSGAVPQSSAIAPLEIPVLDPNERKRFIEMCTQTTAVKQKSVEVQTTIPYEAIMKVKAPLTMEQSTKACEFLKGIVKTTSDLGQLMIQKSEDFIQKKINIKNVTDTYKLDYCVKKSFLLFKLAKHNLMQMEEDLSNEYEQFLKNSSMLQYREAPKCVEATPKPASSDSDCEIIEETVQEKTPAKPKINLKTVFLNKELSIKIAKKSSEEPQPAAEKVNMKARHTVWINDSIMVKKVKPTQSFLAQDSRNKKPPDSVVTIEMVNRFFDDYYKKQKVLNTCAPFVSPEWMYIRQIGVCYYFIAQSDDLSAHSPILITPQTEPESTNSIIKNKITDDHVLQPITLQILCVKALQKYMYNETKSDKSVDDKLVLGEDLCQPNTLFRLSFNVISSSLTSDDVLKKPKISRYISPLQILSLNSINDLLFKSVLPHIEGNMSEPYITKCKGESKLFINKQVKRSIETLFSKCVKVIQKTNLCIRNYKFDINKNKIMNTVKPLKCMAFEKIKQNLYNDYSEFEDDYMIGNCVVSEDAVVSNAGNYPENECCIADEPMALTIESVNTLSDDIFSKIPDSRTDNVTLSLQNDDSDLSSYDQFEHDYEESNQDDNVTDDSNWVSRVQLQELKSCFMPVDDKTSKTPESAYDECNIASIKIEPIEEITEIVNTPIIKNEPTEIDEMVDFTPLVTKAEKHNMDDNDETIADRSSNSYDEDAFESFARTSKMLQSDVDYDLSNEEIFSQSALRVRRQFEPDMEDDLDTGMSLLIPQGNIELAKDRLMESSSDDGTDAQKNITKKKRKSRPKNTRQKNKDGSTNKEKNAAEDEVALLTKRMKDRIRQEEQKEESSESELENSLALRLGSFKKTGSEKTKSRMTKDADNQIQCNDVDSTESHNNSSIILNKDKMEINKKRPTRSSFRNKAKENILLSNNDPVQQDDGFVMQSDEPVELLECEPTLPMMPDYMENIEMDNTNEEKDTKTSGIEELVPEIPFIDRHGWKCYAVDTGDTKLYEHTYILLEKLPESFVETYFRYQGMTDKDKDDTDVDRLTNLQSLHRNVSKENKARNKTNRVLSNGPVKKKSMESGSGPSSPIYNEDCNEFSPSEDEGANVDDEIIPPVPHQDAAENAIAKNCLMNEMDSDTEKPSNNYDIEKIKDSEKIKDIKVEPGRLRRRPGPKSKCTETKDNDSLMLTADKMMNKELTLLHAPVKLSTDTDFKDVLKKPSPKNKSSAKQQAHLERVKVEEDSSSEEEKQWVTTKEKLLKRLEKKQDDPSVDDAKRAKLVSEFIERRGEAPEKRSRGRHRSRRSSKKFLERQKQMSVLNKELFGEVDTSHTGRKHSNAFGKGRKNIRKVIDKKSLARSTVIANMEEFERKRRLNMQQTRLREELGCEEGVNVLVINDEVCLEYDFDEMRPVVTVHPFFTKVMKAHQYEGVKFMWDACFESLAMVQSGHAGGGCILAHCMGLGKTLQVLALLHTVLTHPRVGMQRVLVCCPLSTVLNWVDEIHKWIGPVTNQIKVFELSKLRKTYERAYQLEDWYNGGGIFIIGYELFRSLTTLDPVLDDIRPTIVNKIRNALLDPGPDVVICDEGHLLKNDSSVLAVAMSRVATRRRIVLTGTPMQNNLREYYCMVNFVKPNLLGTYSEYSNRFENPIMNGQHRDSQEADIKLMKARTHILHKVLEGCLQRQEASVLYPYLPKKHEYTVFIPPTKCQWDLYKHYIMTYAMAQQQKHKQSVLKDFHVLQKIWTHPQVLHNFLMKERDERNKIKIEKLEDDLAREDLAASEDVKPSQTEVWWLQYLEGGGMLESLESSNKFLVVFQLIEECIALGDKILIFSTSLYTMDSLEYFLKHINKWSLGQEYFRLDGSVPAEVRQKWCREFNAEHNVNTKLFLISTRAGCLGLNMTAANRVIILDTSWNPAHDIQSIFRVYRFGQKKDCYIYRLVAMGTMEQKIYERAVTKQAVACRVVDEQQIDRHYNMSELTELYRFDEEGTSVEAGLAAGVADVALLRVAARARLHAVREHDSLLRGSREQHLPEHERAAAWMQFQQEHANNEMQDRLLEAGKKGIQHMLAPGLEMMPGLTPFKTENEESQAITQPQSKGKKGKKGATANIPTPCPEPNLSQVDSDKEDAKVRLIMKLLIRHNFLTTKPAHEIAKLVSNVRQIVDNKGVGLDECDELTRSIATVMLQEVDIAPSTSPLPPTDLITGDLDNIPRQVEIKQEVPDVDVQFNDTNDSSHLVPVRDQTRKHRGKPRKYCVQEEKIEPIVTRMRGRARKEISDIEYSSMDESKGLQSSSSSSSRITSKRLRKSPRRSYVSDIDESPPASLQDSKESSPALFNEPMEKIAKKQKINCQISASSESNLSVIEDRGVSAHDEAPSFIVDHGSPESIDSECTKNYSKKVKKPRTEVEASESNNQGKSKRKAALVAKQHLESLDGDDIVTLDDDDYEWINDNPKSNTSKATSVSETTKHNKTKTVSTEPTQKAEATTKDQRSNEQNSIVLLSDEEEVKQTEPATSQSVETVTTEPEEDISLHPSMLSNENFIKIVAYAYQSNRMLDEDAAMLAAQYSTQKALKEIETTGKKICSGPLYDIAIKVLGKDVLKKLHDKKDRLNKKKENVLPAAINNITKEPEQSKPTSPVITLKVEKIKPKQKENEILKAVPSPTSVVNKRTSGIKLVLPKFKSSSSDVVPVGMFKGPSIAMNQSNDAEVESILPDDDDVIFRTSPPISTSNVYKKHNSQPLIITGVSSTKKPETVTTQVVPDIQIIEMESRAKPQQHVYLTIENGKVVVPSTNGQDTFNVPSMTPSKTVSVPVTAVSSKETPSVSSEAANVTISLDSDEEDNVPPPPPPLFRTVPARHAPLPARHALPPANHVPPPLRPKHPTPVAVSTSNPANTNQILKLPLLTDSQGVPLVFQLNDAPTQATLTSDSTSQSQQQNYIIVPGASDNFIQPIESVQPVTPTSSSNVTIVGAEEQPVGIKKVCKPGDIVRITKHGNLKVLSRVEKMPEIIKKTHTFGKKPLSDSKVIETKVNQTVSEKRKHSISNTMRPNTSGSSDDPLSILKDVVHIRADEYDAVKTQKTDQNKLLKSVLSKQSVQPKIDLKSYKSSQTISSITRTDGKTSFTSLLDKYKLKNAEHRNTQSKTVGGFAKNLSATQPDKFTASSNEKRIEGAKFVVKGSTKDILICTKPSGSSIVTKASASASNSIPGTIKSYATTKQNFQQKRTSPWPESNIAKKKKNELLKPTMTLKDFNLDDIDDIIELE